MQSTSNHLSPNRHNLLLLSTSALASNILVLTDAAAPCNRSTCKLWLYIYITIDCHHTCETYFDHMSSCFRFCLARKANISANSWRMLYHVVPHLHDRRVKNKASRKHLPNWGPVAQARVVLIAPECQRTILRVRAAGSTLGPNFSDSSNSFNIL